MTTMEWRIRYERRIKSAQWRNMRRDIAKMRGGKCERCGRASDLELHHKTYVRLGRELMSDLELLCVVCHEQADAQRAAVGRQRSARAMYEAGLDTFAAKKYRENWSDRVDEEQVMDEFDAWLEDQ